MLEHNESGQKRAAFKDFQFLLTAILLLFFKKLRSL